MVPFPFSDLSARKLRPAIVAAHAELGDIVLCQVTSRAYSSERAVPIRDQDLSEGALRHESFVRPDKLFTADPVLVVKTVGVLGAPTLARLRSAIREIFD